MAIIAIDTKISVSQKLSNTASMKMHVKENWLVCYPRLQHLLKQFQVFACER